MILLTGASGFLGRHLLEALLATHGAEGVAVIASAPFEGVATLLRNGNELPEGAFRQSPFDKVTEVIHAGAFIPKNAAEANDWLRCTDNITFTQSLLKALPPLLQRFVFISTVDVYGPAEVISEGSTVVPQSLYGHSKFYCEETIKVWAATSGAVIQNLRLGHIYGPGEEGFKKIIPESFRRILGGEALQLWGRGEELRSFIYAKDAARAILKSLSLDSYAGPVNIAGGRAISMRTLMDLIQKMAGTDTPMIMQPASAAGRSLSFNNERMRSLLGDEQITLEEGLRREWLHMKNLHEQNLL